MRPSKKQEINDDAITDYFRRLNESMDARNREYEAKLASTDVKHELDKIKSSLDKMFTTESYDDDMLKLVIERAIEQHVAAHFEIKDVPTCPSDIGRNIQIYEGYQLYQFVFENPYLPTQFVLLGEVLHENERSSTRLHP